MRTLMKWVGAGALAFMVAMGAPDRSRAQESQVIVAQSAEPVGLDVARNNLQHSLNVAFNIQDRLFDPLDDGGVGPGLAESWEFTNETTLRVKLRPGLKFHNGEPVDAEAVKFSLERLQNPAIASPHAARMKQITGVRVIDPLTIEFVTAEPFAPILHLMSIYLAIVPPKAAAATDPDMFNRRPIGAGPYVFEKWDRGGDIVLKAFDGHWAGKPAYDRVIFRTIPEESARVAALLTGEVGLIEGVSRNSQNVIEKSGRGRLTDSMGIMNYVGLNTYEKPFNDPRVRQALNYGINRELINKALFAGKGILTAGPLSPRTFGADLSLKPYPYDPEKAKALLAEAGYPEGFSTTLSYPTDMVQIREETQAIAADLAKIGIKVALKPLDRAVMVEQYRGRKQDMYMYWWDDNPEPDRYAYTLFHSNSRDYYYKNAETNTLLDKGRSTLDRGEREKIYQEFDRRLSKEAPWVYLYVIPVTYGVSPNVDYQGRRDGFLFMRYASPKKG
ncbi:Peptide/nickel transport system substrate-binding protein [Hyphomicrobiales bacterium]|nr:Peptide/nickel transport system substrate-binding protein [Hyphomicrobiales bacterium]CAH1690751.1 Peptide/nickel transport system substrate-binding protein [Hyphomicrobiales bacterium]